MAAEGLIPALDGLHVDLIGDGVGIRDGFLAPVAVRRLVDCMRTRRERGDFRPARIGGAARPQRRDDIRGDSTCWLDEPLFDAERELLAAVEDLRLHLNREAFLGLFDHELHYACYPPGSGYARHVDQPQGRSLRRVSLIVYLNEEWHPGSAGELRVFDESGYRDIEPVAGRLVCFLTSGREHAVLPTRVERLSISGWLRCRPADTEPVSAIRVSRIE